MIISSDVKNYIKFCSTLGLKQLIKVPTRITFNSFPLIDHTLTSSNEKVVQASIIETSVWPSTYFLHQKNQESKT